jgi:hypothetical protein
VLRRVPIVLSFLALAAHFLRGGHIVGVVVCLLLPFLLGVRRVWAAWVLRGALAMAGLWWVRILAGIAAERRSLGEPWLRMALILGGVAVIAWLSILAVPRPER